MHQVPYMHTNSSCSCTQAAINTLSTSKLHPRVSHYFVQILFTWLLLASQKHNSNHPPTHLNSHICTCIQHPQPCTSVYWSHTMTWPDLISLTKATAARHQHLDTTSFILRHHRHHHSFSITCFLWRHFWCSVWLSLNQEETQPREKTLCVTRPKHPPSSPPVCPFPSLHSATRILPPAKMLFPRMERDGARKSHMHGEEIKRARQLCSLPTLQVHSTIVLPALY